jgi:tryptophan-rich sensory protein
MSWQDWYNALQKPSWTPPGSTIGMIWSVLYPILFVSIAFVSVQAIRRRLPWRVLIPFGVNLVSNVIFTPIQFGLRNLELAALDILIVWGSIVWMMLAVWRHYRWVTFAQVPYLLWVTTATVLLLSITWLNRGR